MEPSKKAGNQKEKFKVKVISSDLPETEKEWRLFGVFDMLFASYPQQNQKIKSKLDTPQK
jgi:hypothetical protein